LKPGYSTRKKEQPYTPRITFKAFNLLMRKLPKLAIKSGLVKNKNLVPYVFMTTLSNKTDRKPLEVVNLKGVFIKRLFEKTGNVKAG
ncbi:MAG: hypothetical protein MI867_28575, partial [Pseudomonadales bacterium]|nr:hypothetical protein [Pseudomonadales bacterium]